MNTEAGNIQKLLFVGVMIAVTLIGRGERVEKGKEAVRSAPPTEEYAAAPLFVLSSPAAPVSPQELPPESRAAPPPAPVVSPPTAPPAPRESASSPTPVGTLESRAAVPLVFRRVHPAPPPDTTARAALVADLETGETYLGRNPDRRWPTASLAKLLAATIALGRMEHGAPVTISAYDFVGGDSVAAKPVELGDTYTVEDLVRAMLVLSSNEAAEAVANAYGRSRFVAAMNVLAVTWGLSHTFFTDPTGLSPADQSTATDLRKLAWQIYRTHPEVWRITQARRITLRELGSNERKEAESTNLLVGTPGFLGGKTGYTSDAGGNLLTLVLHGQRPVLVLVLGSEDRFGESEALIEWFKANFRINV